MFNCIIDGFPTEYKGYPIETDFRYGILLSLLLEDETVEDDIKMLKALDLVYKERVPDDMQVAVDGVIWFLSLGRSEIYYESEDKDNKVEERVIDFNIDSMDIWGAFMVKLNIDLSNIEYMHWFKFMTLISNLGECPLTQKIGYRSTDLSKLKGDTKKYYSELKEKYRIKRVLTKEEHDMQIAAIKESPLFGSSARRILGLE